MIRLQLNVTLHTYDRDGGSVVELDSAQCRGGHLEGRMEDEEKLRNITTPFVLLQGQFVSQVGAC